MPFATQRAQMEQTPLLLGLATFEYPPDLLPELQDTLSQLADVEFLYEARMDRLSNWRPGEIARRQRLERYLDARRKRERRDCEHRLSALKQRIYNLMGIKPRSLDF